MHHPIEDDNESIRVVLDGGPRDGLEMWLHLPPAKLRYFASTLGPLYASPGMPMDPNPLFHVYIVSYGDDDTIHYKYEGYERG